MLLHDVRVWKADWIAERVANTHKYLWVKLGRTNKISQFLKEEWQNRKNYATSHQSSVLSHPPVPIQYTAQYKFELQLLWEDVSWEFIPPTFIVAVYMSFRIILTQHAVL